MPCTPMKFKLQDGTVAHAILCTRGARPSLPCVVCGRPHTKLCDGRPGAWPMVTASKGTCSAPLCDDHAEHREPDMDYCPRCALREGKLA